MAAVGAVAARLTARPPLAVSLPAGAKRVALAPFVVLTTIGCALWALGWTLAGVLAAGAWASIDSIAGHVLLAAGLLILAASLLRRS